MKLLSNRESLTERQVGGKFARQAAMHKAGLPIPNFFCLDAEMFATVVGSTLPAIRERLLAVDRQDAGSIRAAVEEVHAMVRAIAIPEALAKAVLARFDADFDPDALVSVRASTVGARLEESEDSAEHPFAGMSESFLYVRRADVLERIRDCWASGFSFESVIYRYEHGFDPAGFAVAVGVQRMVFGERSFVLFTSDPKTAARDCVLVAGHGIGEGVVQERVPTDHYFVNANSDEIRSHVVNKDVQLTLDRARGHGLVSAPVPPDRQDTPALAEADIRRLVEAGRRIEKLFGCPQDIEGCFTADGTLHILQARPIAFDYGRQRIWSNSNITESFPGASMALTYTFARYFYRVIFYDCYRLLGISPRRLHDSHEILDRMIGYLAGHVYYCLTSFYYLHRQSPLFPIFRAHWEKMMGFSSSYQTHATSILGRLGEKLCAALATGWAVVTVAYRYFTHESAMRHFHRWWETLFTPLRGNSFADTDPFVTMNRFHDVWRQVGNEWGVTLMNDTYMPVLYGWAEQLLARWRLAPDDPGLLSDLLCGDEQLQSVEILLSSVRLAEQVRADAALAERFRQSDEHELWQALEKGELPAGFSAAVREHLHRCGDRGLQELKLEQPSLRQTPWVLMRVIKEYARQAVTEAQVRSHEEEVRRTAEQRLSGRIAGHPLRRWVLRFLLGQLRAQIRNRENSRYCRSELFGFSRQVFLGLATQLVKRNQLDAVEDVFHLSKEEVFGYFDGTGVDEDLRAIVSRRRAQYEAHCARDTAELVTSLGPVRDAAIDRQDTAHEEGALQGLGSSAGRVSGIARVVIDPNSVQSLAEDTILIARETDPGWLFLMLAAKGIVVERGSMLSHTAITGRKFGIPTIVSLPDATRRIPDGARIEMDGASGVVRLLEGD